MIGLVLVTHGRLAVEFRAALEHVVGAQEQIETITIGPDDDVEQRRRDIIEAVKRADSGDGVVLAGINLPMLVKLAKVRADCALDKSVAAAQEAGKKYITVASRVLAGK